jgi:outer membrane lipoprotein LolB
VISRAVVSAVTLALVTACAGGPPAKPVTQATAGISSDAIDQWRTWRAVGRLAVKTGTGGFNAHFEWRQLDQDTDLTVEGPFGAGHARITAHADHIRIAAGNVPPMEFDPPYAGLDEALTQQLGFTVPLHAVSYWLRGVPDPELPSGAEEGGFAQAGWRVESDRPGSPSPGINALPRRVTLTQANSRLRIVIDDWVRELP